MFIDLMRKFRATTEKSGVELFINNFVSETFRVLCNLV